MLEGTLGFVAMGVLMLLRVPIALAMAIVGVVGVGLMRSWTAAFSTAATEILAVSSYALSVIPLFVLMGNFITHAGMSRELYRAAHTFVGHRPGGLAMSTVLACAGFGAICGSSIATVATMARVAMPEMRRFNYDPAFAAGSICAGSTLGILIPPSVIMVIYGIMTEQSIGALFAAGLIPGIIATGFYLGACLVVSIARPDAGPAGPRATWGERARALGDIWSVLALFIAVMGGLYGGIFTPTEAAGIGATLGGVLAFARKSLSVSALFEVLAASARTTAMLFTILIGAMLFANFLNFTGLPRDLLALVVGGDFAPIWVVVAICAMYVLLGMVMESLSMMLLTIPIFFPLIVALNLDPIWFGIIIVCIIEISLITPPVGMNIFVLSSEVPDVPTSAIWKGVLPFVLADVIRMGVLIAFPALTLFLPRLLDL